MMKVLKKFLAAAAVFLLTFFLPGPVSGEETYESLFTRYFEGRIDAGSVLAVLSADEENLRRGNVPSLTVCIENAAVEGVAYDRLLLVLTDVYFTVDGGGVRIHSYSESRLSGSILKKDFLARLKKNMPHYAVSELELKDGRVMMKGVYERKGLFKLRALIRLTGQYVVGKDGIASIRFDDSTNDNPMVSAADVGRAAAKAAPVISFRNFFAAPRVWEVRVDHDMVWFSAK